jgi:hypothetical protein
MKDETESEKKIREIAREISSLAADATLGEYLEACAWAVSFHLVSSGCHDCQKNVPKRFAAKLTAMVTHMAPKWRMKGLPSDHTH